MDQRSSKSAEGATVTVANVAALERLFVEWSKTGGRVPSWEYLAAHGCLAVNAVTVEQLGRAAAASDVRAALLRLATGDAT
jgi:hypothetical protein